MAARIQRTMTLMLGGTSLTAGRLCNPPLPWTYYLFEDMKASPECQGPVRIINTGAGSQTSNFGASQAILKAPLRPTHVLMEDFAINDCAIGPVTIPQATANFNSMVASYRAANPDVVIVHQTMSPASAGDASRTNLPIYYDNGLANAVLNDIESLDNYHGTLLVPGGWPKPLPQNLTVAAPGPDGFSPWTGTLNPSDKNAAVTLTGSNLIATVAGATVGAVRGTVGNLTQKYYADFLINVLGNQSIGMGAASMSLANGFAVGNDVNSVGYRPSGDVYYNGGVIATLSPYGLGDVVNIAQNGTIPSLWFGLNGVWLNGDPASGAGGIGGTPGTTRYAACSMSNGGRVTANFSTLSNFGDGLHPIWPNAFQVFSYPNILAWARQAMADFW